MYHFLGTPLRFLKVHLLIYNLLLLHLYFALCYQSNIYSWVLQIDYLSFMPFPHQSYASIYPYRPEPHIFSCSFCFLAFILGISVSEGWFKAIYPSKYSPLFKGYQWILQFYFWILSRILSSSPPSPLSFRAYRDWEIIYSR